MSSDVKRPDWAKESAGAKGVFMAEGVDVVAAPKVTPHRRPELSEEDYVAGVLAGDRGVLSRAITLIESNAPRHFDLGQRIITRLLPHTGKAMRVGITGVPGAGKSSLIEALGCRLVAGGKKVAVLAVDPSSSISKGSILGDKTRMERLSREEGAFIRPSPSGGTLGGVSRKSRETMLLCEAAGYEVVLVETVGVGQSETTVRGMVDLFLMVALTGAGDDLQGMKKGIMEIADAIWVNKADGDNRQKALTARADFEQMLHYLRPSTPGWQSPALAVSAYTGEGLDEAWTMVERFFVTVKENGVFQSRRREQTLTWIDTMVDEYLQDLLHRDSEFLALRESSTRDVLGGRLSPTIAASHMIDALKKRLEA